MKQLLEVLEQVAEAMGLREAKKAKSAGKTHTDSSFLKWLEDTLIPDLKEMGQPLIAKDFEKGIRIIRGKKKGRTVDAFVYFLEDTLIPDLMHGQESIAEEFQTLVGIMRRHELVSESMGEAKKSAGKKLMAPVTSLMDLKNRAARDGRYVELAIMAAHNLGGPSENFREAMQTLFDNAAETDEEGVVDEINGVRDLVEAKPSYEEWLAKVDREVQAQIGCSVHDLSDAPLVDWYDNGKTPKAAAAKAIRLSGGGMGKND